MNILQLVEIENFEEIFLALLGIFCRNSLTCCRQIAQSVDSRIANFLTLDRTPFLLTFSRTIKSPEIEYEFRKIFQLVEH